MKLFFGFLSLFLISTNTRKAEYINDHLVIEYPEEWIIRPVANTSQRNLILETEKLSIWSPLNPNEDRKQVKLTSPSSIYYKNEPSLKRLNKEIWRAAKSEFEDSERLTSEQGVKEGIPFIKASFSHTAGSVYDITEYYIFSVQSTPYVLYLTSSRKEYMKQKPVWDKIWSNVSFQD